MPRLRIRLTINGHPIRQGTIIQSPSNPDVAEMYIKVFNVDRTNVYYAYRSNMRGGYRAYGPTQTHTINDFKNAFESISMFYSLRISHAET